MDKGEGSGPSFLFFNKTIGGIKMSNIDQLTTKDFQNIRELDEKGLTEQDKKVKEDWLCQKYTLTREELYEALQIARNLLSTPDEWV